MRQFPKLARLALPGVLAHANVVAFTAALALPVALLHARAVAEILVAAIDCLFLASRIRRRDTAWWRSGFAMSAGLWWVWLVICSALSGGGLLGALVSVRLPLLSLAIGCWVLDGDDARANRRRQALWGMLAAAACWIALQSWEQYLTGTNIFGDARYVDGALSGPFLKPRAGPAYILVFFPALIPAATVLLSRPALRWRAAGLGLVIFAALTTVLIGQRMPSVLMVLGFAATGLLLPRLRMTVTAACMAAIAMLALTPWVSPGTYGKLVGETAPQLAHFAQSDYGQVFTRAIAVAELHPWRGLGFDGFRRGCTDPATWHGIAALAITTPGANGGMPACNIHPHNYYLEAWDNAGWPGLWLFCAMVGTALARVAKGLSRAAPLQIGVFVGLIVAFWPLASTSAFTSMPNGGWVFLVLGLGLGRRTSG